ncbi:MAG: hypothetical protein H7250_12455 [Flavobacterium sp.]|nr:hypothetical protein [Flavobacterium sp.]
MEPNNLENQFAEKLNAREIKPSLMAWDRLDAMLTVVEKPKRNFNWLYIAASFLGFILIATIFFNQTETVIDVEKKEVVLEDSTNTKINFKSQIQKSILNNNNKEVVVSSKNENPKSNFKNQVQKLNLNIKNNEEVVFQIKNKNTKNQSIISQKTEQVNQNQMAAISNPKSHVTLSEAEVPNLNSQNPKPNYVNVDELLAAVEQPTSPQKSEKIFSQKANVNVNASTLLSQVDGEIELTFREKVIKSVNKNFKTVKVALANRNNQ